MKPLLRRCGHPLTMPTKVLLLGSPLLSGHQVLDIHLVCGFMTKEKHTPR